MKLNYSYDLPFGRGRQFLGAPNGLGGHVLDGFVGGWGIAGITNWDPKGVPVLMPRMDIGVTAPGAALRWSLANNNYQKSSKNYGRAVYVRGSFINPGGAGIMNRDAFSPTPDYSLSNAPFVFPNLRAPGDFSTDATLLKKFQLGDKAARYLETRIEATNVFNHPTYGTPGQNAVDADPDSPTFGGINGKTGSRIMQIGLRLFSDFPAGAGHSFPAPHFLFGVRVHGRLITTFLTASLIACFGAKAPAQRASLGTAQTVVRLQAGATAPHLLSLQAPGKPAWSNTATEDLIATVEEDGHSVPLHWKLIRSAGQRDAKHISFVYETVSPHLRLTWEWSAPAATGPLEHRIRIENLDTRALWLPLQTSFRYSWTVAAGQALKQIYIDKGAGKPSAIGTHELAVSSGYQWEGKSSTYATDGEPREIIPWFMVERNGEQGDGWHVGVEFSGRTSLTLERASGSVRGTVGLNPNPGPFCTLLQPGATFAAPTVFVGAFTGGRDGLGNVLRPWVRQVLTYSGTWKKPDYPLLVNNSWGSGMAVDEKLAKRMIDDSADLGMEMFGLDAGWFRGVGDWYPNPKKFPNGLAPVADEAHRRGLKFGIWVDWAQAGTDTEPGALNVNDPVTRSWLVADTPPGWKPDDFVGRTTDIGMPAAKDHAQRELERMISSYKLDMVEHDGYLVAHNCSRTHHPHAPPPRDAVTVIKGSGITMPDTANSTDVSYHAVRSYYDIYSHLRRQHPDVMFEICNDGGRMVDFGSASHGDYFSITDTYNPLSNRRAFYDTSQVLPAAMLEDYVEKWPTPRLENFRYMLRSGMMGWLTVMQNTNAWTTQEHAAAKQEFALYKEKLRPFIRDADLYHISARPDGVHWDGIEYYDTQDARGVVYAFRGSATADKAHTFPLYGLQPGQQYRLHFQDGSSADRTESGHDLMSKGLSMALTVPNSSELVFIDEVR